MSTLAFIPARGGSKGLPGKNLRLLAGKPLVQYTIESALSSGCFDHVIVSTDSPEILSVASSCGLDCSYKRPDALAGDEVGMVETVIHAIRWLEARSKVFDSVAVLQPTSPLRTADDIRGAISLFTTSKVNSLVSVHPMNEHPYECVVASDFGWSWLRESPKHSVRRQDYKERFFFINGAIYLISIKRLLNDLTLVHSGETILYEMQSTHGVDIDTIEDFHYVEFLSGLA
jgi:N-acylneuraminate cytidylyltransferase/CMP-N,N'-diacetyllegionaminic acid synthase